MAEEKAKEGRPSKYKAEFVEQARNFCLLGAKDSELARIFQVTEATLNNWKVEHPEFFDAIKQGRERADAEVAKSLYKRACGYESQEEDVRVVNGKVVVTKVKKVYPPDSISMIFWLKNRQKEYWRDKQEISASIDVSDDFKAALLKAKTLKAQDDVAGD